MNFDTFEQMEKGVIKVFQDIWSKDVSKMSKQKGQRGKQVAVYDAYQPTQYDRTFEFLYSNETRINKPRSNSISLTLFTDTRNKAMPSKHPSWTGRKQENGIVSGGKNMNKAIPHFMEGGNNSSRFSYRGRQYIGFTLLLIEQELKKTVVAALKSRGISAY